MIARVRLHLPRAAFVAAACAAALAGTQAAAQADAEIPVRVSYILDWPEASSRLQALYPPTAVEAGVITGHARVRFRVMTDGTVDTASIAVLSRSRPEFAPPAREWVARMRFAPTTVGGRPVAAWIRWNVNFYGPGAEEPVHGVSRASGSFTPPVLLNADELPALLDTHRPAALREAGVPGTVVVQFVVLPTGEVDPDRIDVVMTTDLALDEPTAATLRALRYSPARSDGTPTEQRESLRLHFGRSDGTP